MPFLGILIPILALCIPLTVVVGKTIIQPLVEAITRLAEAQRAAGSGAFPQQQRFEQLEARLDGIERSLGHIEEEYEFRRQLERRETAPLAPPAGSDGPAR